ncbi:hypothetical protein BC831DRAFT_398774 [Entophlyctis helioformis]|nr:hypothetical protein BC831DRAFT_398774 [Entophlyctis helioformis]
MALTALTVYGHSVDVIGDSSATASPLWEGIGYPGPHPGIDRPSPHSIWRPSFLPVPLACFDQHRSDAGRAAVSDADLPVLSYDVVVIGSGAGGGIVAAELSKAGHSVLLLDKARYTHTTDLPKSEAQAYKLLYENSAGLITEDGSMQMLAGKAWGGGTQINWSASLFQKSVDAVTSRAGVGTSAVRHNPSNQLLLDGCRALGFDNDTIPQNTAGKHHSCGGCCLGCPTAEKQGTLPTWIRDASDAGCHFIDAAYAEHVIHQGGVAQGVVIRVDGGSSSNPSAASVRLRVHAKRVVSSCGAINTPAFLLRSKLTNRFIGRNLKLHPVTSTFGVFPDRKIDPSQGSIMTAISNQVADLDGNGYGARIEVPSIHAGSFATLVPWRSAADYKRLLLQFPQTASLISLTRDDDSKGTVFIDSDGKARINWTLSAKDSKHALEGLKTAMHILIAAGATEIYSAQNGVPSFFRPAGMSPAQTLESREFKDFIALMDRKGVKVNSTPMFGAHQMGSARMAPSARYGAVNPYGETFDVRGLYVADTSVFPTASGVK